MSDPGGTRRLNHRLSKGAPQREAITAAFRSNQGRDVVVGDVHGFLRTLDHALSALAFDPGRDRLFGVGDLVERDPHSTRALEWIEHHFAGVTQGNHDRRTTGLQG